MQYIFLLKLVLNPCIWVDVSVIIKRDLNVKKNNK